MARTSDLTEAHTHLRRRLGAALVATEPVAGDDGEPDGAGRRLLAGAVLTLLLLAGGAATRLLEDRADAVSVRAGPVGMALTDHRPGDTTVGGGAPGGSARGLVPIP